MSHSRGDRVATHLPPEIWALIFTLATHVPGAFVTQVQSAIEARKWEAHNDYNHRESMKVKRSIIVVSRSWNAIGMELLWTDIRLSSISQRDAIQDRLDQSAISPGRGVGRWIKRLYLDADGDLYPTRVFANCRLHTFLRHCPNLVAFVMPRDESATRRLARLNFFSPSDFDNMLEALSDWCPKLRRISSRSPPLSKSGKHSALASVERVQIPVQDNWDKSAMPLVTSLELEILLPKNIDLLNWRYPCLLHLSLKSVITQELDGLYSSLIRDHGAQLQSLSLDFYYTTAYPPAEPGILDIFRTLDHVPNLEELQLSLPSLLVVFDEPNITYPRLVRLAIISLIDDEELNSGAEDGPLQRFTATFLDRLHFPNIGSLTLFPEQPTFNPHTKPFWERFERKWRDAGVAVDVCRPY